MGAIFISHSSEDLELVNELKDWLFDEHRHESFFLDFDPEVGIAGGSEWEGELYRRIGSCRAVIVLCTKASMQSRWCFAEIALARSLGKPVFPILVEPCEVFDVLKSVQAIDLGEGRDVARRRLTRALETAGLHSADLFGWNAAAGRSPYPGLVSFEEEDAGVFFGREQETGEALDRLNQIRRQGGGGILLILGASGSGKSSLVRAGLIPRLRRDPGHWLVLNPGRPGNQPRRTVARILAEALAEQSGPDAGTIYSELTEAGSVEAAGDVLAGYVSVLSDPTKPSSPRVLLILDQFEELLLQDQEHPSYQFLAVLRHVLSVDDSNLVLLATMRSDFLGEFQRHESVEGLNPSSFALGPVSTENRRMLIQEPARLCGFEIDETLVDLLLQEADSDYALPLLAFTLRELYENHADEKSRQIRVEHYRDQLGGIEGAIRKAVERRLPATLSEADEEALRKAFLAMARLDEKGRVRRHAVQWVEIEDLMGGAAKAERLLGPFVDGLLLRPGVLEGGERTVEVTHEAIFSHWRELDEWIRQNSDDLRLREQLSESVERWSRSAESTEHLLTQPSRLHQALELCSEQRVPLTDEFVRFVRESEAFVTRRQRRAALIRTVLTLSAAAAALAMAVLWKSAQRSERRSVREHQRAQRQVSRVLAAETELRDLDLGLLLAVEALAAGDTLAARDALAAKVFEQPDLVRFLSGHNDWVTHMASGGEGRVLVSVGRSGPALLWDVGSGRSMQALGEADSEIEAVALSRDGGSLALGDVNHRLTIWQLDRHTARAMLRHTLRASVQSLAVSPDGKVLAGGDPSVGIRLWDTETSAQILVQPTEPLQVPRTMSFSHDGRLLASGDAKGRLVVWRREEDELRRVWEVVAGSKEVLRVVFSPTEGLLAWVHEGEDVIHYCRVDSQSGSALAACPSTLPASWPRLPSSRSTAQAEPDAEPYDGHTDSVVDLAFSPDGTRLASAGLDLSARVWEIPEGGPLEAGETLLHKLPVESVAFVEGGSRLATGVRGEEGTQNNRIRLWAVGVENGSLEAGPRMRGLGFDSKSGVLVAATSRKVTLWNTEGEELDWAPPPGRFTAMSVSGGWLVTGESLRRDPDGKAARITVWDLATRESMGELKLESEVSSLAADPARGLVAVGQRDGIVGLWRPGESDLAISTDVSGEVRTVSLAAEGNQLLAVSETGEMVSWDMKGSPVPARAHLSADVTSAGVSADGRFVALGTQSGEVLLWDNDSRQLVEMPGHRVHGEQDSVAAVAFSPDGRRLASASSFIHVWDLELERMQFSLPELDGEVSDLVFSSDGETLAFGYKSQVRLLPLDIERWVELACGRANRDLTPEEWRRYMIEGEPQSTCAAASVAVAGLVAAGEAGD